MPAPLTLSELIDQRNRQFSSPVRMHLARLSGFSASSLEWLVMEHYQFSHANVDVLQRAVASTSRLAEQGVSRELQRNANEENGHARMYRRAMLEVGTDVDARVEFAPTSAFLDRMRELAGSSPSEVLGALYATETAAIFEHETFFDVCEELCARRGILWQTTAIKAFHDLHLGGGVEQGHKDGLSVFVDSDAIDKDIDKDKVALGAFRAIDAMAVWWRALLSQLSVRALASNAGTA